MRTRWMILASLLAVTSAGAQVSNPASTQVKDEGTPQGFVRTIDCVGSALLCSVSGGTATFTVSAPSLGGTNTWTGANDFVDTNFRIHDGFGGVNDATFATGGLSGDRVFTLPDVTTTLAGFDSANAFTATNAFLDNNLLIVGSVNFTKIARFEVDGFTASNTRTFTLPGLTGNDTMATWAAANAFSGTNSFADGNLSIVGSSDPTKVAKFEVDGFTASNTRVFTLPGLTGNDTLMSLTATQNYDGFLTVRFGRLQFADNVNIELGSAAASIKHATVPTPDTTLIQTDTTSNAFHVIETADAAFDFNNGPCGTSACSDPTFVVHSHNQSTTQWASLAHNGTNAVLATGAGNLNVPSVMDFNVNGNGQIGNISFGGAYTIYGNSGNITNHIVTGDYRLDASQSGTFKDRMFVHNLPKALTESSATAVTQVSLGALNAVGGRIDYTVYAADATDVQARSGSLIFQAVNKAATETCVIPATATETTDGSNLAASAGTLTYTWTCDGAPTNGIQFYLNAVSSLTQTSLSVTWSMVLNPPAILAVTVTPQ